MISEPQSFPLGDIIRLIIDYRGKTPKKLGSDWSAHGYRALSAKNIKTGQIVQPENIRFVDDCLYRRWMKDEIQRFDILITSEAPFGEVFLWDSDEKIVLSQRLFALRCKESFYPPYIYYYMTTKQFQSELRGRATGTTVTGLRQPELLKCIVKCPNYMIQKAIANTLSALDARIALNKKINHHLEQMAQAIFKSWFVDFDPWDGKQPTEWQTGNLTDIADYLNGLAMQRFRPVEGEVGLPVLKIKELRQGSCDSQSELCSSSVRSDYIVHDGDVIFSWSGSLLVDFWCGGDCGLNQHLFKVTSRKYDKWFYYAWTCHHLARFITMAADKATTMGHIKREALESAEVIIPDEDNYCQLDSLLAPLYEQVINNRVENRKLSLLRDTLLPRLMAGELSVADFGDAK